VRLGEALRARASRPVDVLNAGASGQRLEGIDRQLPRWIPQSRPDMVIYYEGYNNAYDNIVGRFHDTWGWLTFRLYYGSMLYTYLVEKIALYKRTWEDAFFTEQALFAAEIPRFVERLRGAGEVPVFALQALSSPPGPQLARLDLKDRAAVRRFIVQTAGPRISLRAAQAHVLIEEVRRAGSRLAVTVIDPRPTFQERASERLFCNEVHLSDRGHLALAEVIAEHLLLPPPAR
jgi:lysophospholipase L1-like esterase